MGNSVLKRLKDPVDAMVWREDDEQEEKDRCGIGVVSEDSPSRFCKNTDKDNVWAKARYGLKSVADG